MAGKATGIVLERDNGASCGFVNGYEQSKYEAETLVRGASVPWVIARPSMLICDDPCGAVSQFNASHYTIRLWRAALVPMLPGSDESLMDVVSRDDVASSIIQLLHHPSAAGVTVHLSGGPRTLRLKDVMELAWETWREDAAWRRCAIPVPALVDLATYSLLEQAIAETADPLLQRIVRSIAAFAPTNAYPKSYDTRVCDALLHRDQADPVTLWRTVFKHIASKARARVAA